MSPTNPPLRPDGDGKSGVEPPRIEPRFWRTISVIKRSHDYHACLKDHPEVWGAGTVLSEAVFSAITSHPEFFGIVIERSHDDA